MTAPAPCILALDAALALCSAAVVADGRIAAEIVAPGERGQVQRLAPMLDSVLRAAGVSPGDLDAVAVTVGPGSFTGIRAALALAHGVALATGALLVGVTVAEALAAALPPLPGRALWVALDSRRGRVFLDRGDGPQAVALTALPRPAGPVAVAGDAAAEIAARLAAGGVDAMLTDARQPLARFVAAAAALRIAQGRAGGAALPLYVDPPEARPPADGLRPRPVSASCDD